MTQTRITASEHVGQITSRGIVEPLRLNYCYWN